MTAYMKKNIRTDSLIITGFAVAHALTAMMLGVFNISDELILTLLTMAMTVILCLRHGLNIEVTAACVIVVNMAGFLLGTEGAALLSKALHKPTMVSSIVTFVTTIILGWGTFWITRIFSGSGGKTDTQAVSKSQTRILITSFVLIFFLRILVFVFSSTGHNPWSTIEILSMILSNTAVIISLVCINIIFVRFRRQIRDSLGTKVYWFIFTLYLLITSQLSAYIVCLSPDGLIRPEVSAEFIHLCMLCLIVEISVYCIIYLANHSLEVQQQMIIEKEKRHYAQFRYEKLKQQVNPHFLFNSLNVLDSLVLDSRTEQASEFIHKLAGLYRYMLSTEDSRLVTLGREMDFVRSFVLLMRTRFPDGFEVVEEIAEADLQKMMPPCAVQMLVENALKHNAVSSTRPLRISLRSEDGGLEVSNELIPKKSKSPSTGVGLKYIKQQYTDLGGGDVRIEDGDGRYVVWLPLIEQ